MSGDSWVPVHRADLATVTLMMMFLQSDGLEAKIVPDVSSAPLRDPAAHNLKSQYTLHYLAARAADEDQARELIKAYLEEDPDSGREDISD